MNDIKKNLPTIYKEKKNKKQAKIAPGMKFTDLAIKALRTELVPAFMGLLGMALGFISLAYCIDLSGKTQFRPYDGCDHGRAAEKGWNELRYFAPPHVADRRDERDHSESA